MEQTRKPVFFTEAAYFAGIFAMALGVALMERADFGVSMIVAPAYVLHLKIVQYASFFTFGTAEYTLQAVLLLALVLVLRKFRKAWLFSFVTAVFYGLVLDGVMLFTVHLPAAAFALRAVWYVLGMLLCSFGVSCIFHTYISPEVYELIVKELALKTGKDIHRVKTAYDIGSCLTAVVLSLLFFGRLEGAKWGTFLCALINGRVIAACTHFLEKRFTFRDGLKLRPYFQ